MKWIIFLLLGIGIICLISCKEFLDIKPNKKLVVLSTTQEAQALLNNILFTTSYPATHEISADNLFIYDTDFGSVRSLSERNAYIWNRDVFNESPRNDWSLSYEKIYNSNIVIDAIKDGKLQGSQTEKNSILGQALFFRAFSFYQLLQLFAKPWDEVSSGQDLGIPMRLSSNFNVTSTRETVNNCYSQIISDLIQAAELLENVSIVKTRPNKIAAYALLARLNLLTGDYEKANEFCDLVIRSGDHQLIDFSLVDSRLAFPFHMNNEEVIWIAVMALPQILNTPILKVDSTLYRAYYSNDFRRSLFFERVNNNDYTFKGSYFGQNSLFCGLSLNEVYLIKAEALARKGKIAESKTVLEKLLSKRYFPFDGIVVRDEDLIKEILKERERELVFRGLRWTDLRRLNKEKQLQKVIRRMINGKEYVLRPESREYVFQIPNNVILLSGIEQNE